MVFLLSKLSLDVCKQVVLVRSKNLDFPEWCLIDKSTIRYPLLRLFEWTENDPVGRQFRKSFKWDTTPDPDGEHGTVLQSPTRLVAWKFTYWLPHSLDSELLLSWLQSDKDMLRSKEPFFKGHAFTPLAMLWESDPHTARITFYSLLSALLAIMLVSNSAVSKESLQYVGKMTPQFTISVATTVLETVCVCGLR